MNIAIDIDEVIVDFIEKCMEFAESKGMKRVCYEDVYCYELWKVLEIEKDLFIELLNEGNITGKFDKLEFIKGAKKGVEFLRDNFDIYFVTARPKNFSKKTRDFIFEEFGILGNRVLFAGDVLREGISKFDICKERSIGLIIEDNGYDSLKYAKDGLKVLLLDKPWNQDCNHDNVCRCFGWDDILEKVKEVENGKVF